MEETIIQVVVGVVILAVAGYGGTRVSEVMPKFLGEFDVEERYGVALGNFSKYVVWLLGIAYFFTALPFKTRQLGYFISSSIEYLLDLTLIVAVLLLVVTLRKRRE